MPPEQRSESCLAADAPRRWIGQSVLRHEDPALLTGQARFIDDLEPVTGLKHVAILRSPHAHANIKRVDATVALAMEGVVGIVTGAQLGAWMRPIPSVVKTELAYYPIAIDRVRYVGEPVAVIVADDRYLAEDAAERVEVDYEPLPVVVDPLVAATEETFPLHPKLASNRVSQRVFQYGDPDEAFAVAETVVEFDYRFPRYSSTPIETFGVIANFEPRPDRFTVWSNFSGTLRVATAHGGGAWCPRQSVTADHATGEWRQFWY